MRDRILATATQLFVERGYDGVAMREISDACGITKAALYYHFVGKADLLDAICTGYLQEISQVVAASADHAESHEAQLRWLVHRLFELPPRRRAIMRLAMNDGRKLEAVQRQAFTTAYRERFISPLRQLVAAGVAAGELRPLDPATVVWLLLGMLYPFFTPPGDGGAHPPEVVDTLLEVLFGGLRVAPADQA
ncbi:MAG: TetR/AcrR family transcriptional regulator [Propionicimonas sp.]